MRISIRFRLALLSLLLLAIPYSGMRLAGIVKDNLLVSRKEALLFSARAVASALTGRKGLFSQEGFLSLDQNKDVYLFELTNPMRLNGKADDWQSHIHDAEHFGIEHIISGQANYSDKGSGFSHLIGKRGEYVYALFLVNDDSLIYRQKNSLSLERSDHLQIAIEDNNGIRNTYFVTPSKPGWINGFLMTSYGDRMVPKESESRIQGVWQPSEKGYIIELRIPGEMIGKRLAFAIGDVDDTATRDIDTIIGTANLDQPGELGFLLSQSATLQEILETLNRPQSRIQIVDSNKHVRASFGTLSGSESVEINQSENSSPLSTLYTFLSPVFHLFTEPFGKAHIESIAQPAELDIEGIKEALLGGSSISHYRLEDADVEIMAAITPLYNDGSIIGAVVVEQTTNSILALKNKVIEESILLTLLFLLFGGCGLLFFAFRLSSRIRQLRNQAAKSIGNDGQILDISEPSSSHDEIGDLSRTLHNVLSQLKAQGQYREKMADNLEHEMRTPLASVSASLKNLADELKDQPQRIHQYVSWAIGDIARMESMLADIRDATSLKAALDQGFKELFSLSEALPLWLEHGWQKAFPDTVFQLTLPEEPIDIHGDPDKVRQMLDKLIENSVAFHTPETPILLEAFSSRNAQILHVTNQGPAIPEDKLDDIFNSMVSERTQQDNKPHLGLGLYIVRTIAQHHGGSVIAKNLTGNESGVRFTISFPRPNLASAQ